MATLGDFQKRLSAIFVEAKAQSYQIQDVIPTDMQEHFNDMKELRVAKEYIKECQEREKQLQTRNDDLEKELKKAKQAVEDLPDDHKALRVDFTQAQHHIEYYKKLMNAAEDRATRYREKWQEALKRQTFAEEADTKIQRLERECEQQKTIINKLSEENRIAADLFDSLREKDLNALEDKEIKIMEMEKMFAETQAMYADLEQESEMFEEAYTGLVAKMENETVDSATALNRATERMHALERMQSATVSEIIPMRNFYERCFSIISIYQRVFQDLFTIDSSSVQKTVYLPDALHASLDSAYKECEAFHYLHKALSEEVGNGGEVREQIQGLAKMAILMYAILKDIGDDVEKFLQTLRQKPDAWKAVKMKFGALGRKRAL